MPAAIINLKLLNDYKWIFVILLLQKREKSGGKLIFDLRILNEGTHAISNDEWNKEMGGKVEGKIVNKNENSNLNKRQWVIWTEPRRNVPTDDNNYRPYFLELHFRQRAINFLCETLKANYDAKKEGKNIKIKR